jgi:hypothetical protein
MKIHGVPTVPATAAAHGHALAGEGVILHHAPGLHSGFILTLVAHPVARRHPEGVGVP